MGLRPVKGNEKNRFLPGRRNRLPLQHHFPSVAPQVGQTGFVYRGGPVPNVWPSEGMFFKGADNCRESASTPRKYVEHRSLAAAAQPDGTRAPVADETVCPTCTAIFHDWLTTGWLSLSGTPVQVPVEAG